eukprot:gnl/MRDRNA2_/MRDRNA2_84218_c0_seq3.p1 gnl/MRDRNA2_/MRDRNA2_84218_c0~~gnl/MRDRNA2_/MRDRNA2_84218_c0_seq3.p1  ORF type:complete len:224 (+),score=62.61 gnl/MRDRNA2_/MRDRNA2_84218_c0_seq3:61-672(+)
MPSVMQVALVLGVVILDHATSSRFGTPNAALSHPPRRGYLSLLARDDAPNQTQTGGVVVRRIDEGRKNQIDAVNRMLATADTEVEEVDAYEVEEVDADGKPKKAGKGKGKGKEGLNAFKPDVKVWVGNLPESVGWKELQEHFNQAGKTKWVESFSKAIKEGKGTGGVAYASAEDATKAISMLNGSILGGQMIQVDVWNKKEKA